MGIVKRLPLAAAIVLAVCLMLPSPGYAQLPIPILSPTASPSPSPSPKPSPTASKSSTPKPKPASTRPSGGSGGGDDGGSSGGSGGGDGHDHGGSGSSAPDANRASMPPAIRAALLNWQSRPKSPAHTTTRLLQLIDAAAGKGAPTLAQQRKSFGNFPVVGYVWYQDDYGAPRFRTFYNFHEGTDLFAVTGTPVTAAMDGRIWKLQSTSDRGKSLWLRAADGSYFFYGHLGRFAPGLKIGQRVRTGQLIGFIGTSADAQGTYPHTHFEYHPFGTGETVNPKPLLDAWLREAETTMVGTVGLMRTRELLAPFGAAHWDTLFGMIAEPTQAPPALWAAGYDGTGSTAAYADLALADLLSAGNWSAAAPELEGLDPLLRLMASAGQDSNESDLNN